MYLYGLDPITLSIPGECISKACRRQYSYSGVSIGNLNVFTDYYRCIQKFIQETKGVEEE
jgi:hypothetical protein